MGLSSPGVPNVPLPPPQAHPPTMGDSAIALTALQARQRARVAEGMGEDDTIKTSPQGVSTPTTQAPSTLLGS